MEEALPGGRPSHKKALTQQEIGSSKRTLVATMNSSWKMSRGKLELRASFLLGRLSTT
jgi:hypothetical protein